MNDAPVLDLNGVGAGVNATLAYTENAAAAAIAPAATVTDVDSANFNGGSLSVAFTANGTAADQLTIRNQGNGAGQIGVSGANVSFGGTVIGVIDAVANGVNGNNLLVTFNNNAATPAATKALINNVLYANSSENPSILPRTVTYTLDDGDGGAGSTAITATVNMTAVNDAPVLDLNGAGAGTSVTLSYTENAAATAIAPAATVTDADSANFNGGTLTVGFTANGTTADRLAIQNQGTAAGQIGVSGSNVSFGGVAIGTFTGGTSGTNLVVTLNGSATPVAAQALVERIRYSNTSDNPSTLARTVNYTLNDGGGSANGGANISVATATINVTAVNDAAAATNLSAGETYTQNSNLNLIDIVVTDPDGPTTIATLKLSNPGAGSLNTATLGGVTSTYNAGTGVWTASGAIAGVNQLLAGLVFTPTTNFTGAFTMATSVSDGVAAAVTGVKTLSSTAANAPPTATNLSAAETYTEDTPLNLIDIVISDTDSPNVSATLTLSNVLAGVLSTATSNLVTSDFDPLTGIWSAAGAVTDVNTLLAGVTFTPESDFNGNFTITTVVSDGVAADITGVKTVAGTAVNDAPVLTLPAAAQSVAEDTALVFSGGNGNLITVSDVDAGGGPLLITLSVTNGVVTLNGTAGLTLVSGGSGASAMQYTGTLTDINAALNGMTYSPTGDFNGGAGMGIVISDQGNTGSGVPVPLNDTQGLGITVVAVNDAPAATITPGPYTATEQVSFDLRDMGLTVADIDAGAGNVEVTVSVASGTLGATAGTTGVTITGSGSSLTFSGNIIQINDLLAAKNGSTFTYINNSDTPPATDTLTLSINDKGNSGGGALTAQASGVINITAVNDAPVPTITQASYSAIEQTSLNLYATGLFVADPDALGLIEDVSLSVGEGTLFVTAGNSLATVTNSGTSTVTISGTLAQINALLNTDPASAVTYINNSDTPGTSTTFTLRIDDRGNTGGGGGRDAAASASIALTPVNDPPAATIAAVSYSATEQVSLDLHGTGLAVSDADAGSGIVTVAVSVASGVLNASAGATSVIVTGTGSSLALSGNIAQINNLLSGNAGGTLTYQSNSDAPPASDALTLQIHDGGNSGGGNLTAQAQVTINITAVNDAPVVTAPASYSASEQIAIDLKNTGLTVGDPDSGANLLTVTLSVSEGILTVVPGTSGVTLVLGSGSGNVLILGTAASVNSLLNSDASSVVRYINDSDTPSSSVTLTLDVNDNGSSGIGGGLTSTVNSTINVAAVNDAPVANADTLTATEDTPVTYTAAQLTGNDTDVDGPVLSIASVTSGTGGTAVLNGDGTVTFTPTANFNGAASFSYTVSDGSATSNTATVTVNVAAVNDAPAATADTLAATEDTPVTYAAASLLGNDADVEGSALTIASVTSVVGGTAVLNGDGTVTFTPSANFNGAASFSYTATDGALTSSAATVSVNVAAVNDAPVAIADTLAATEDTPITYTAAELTGNDTDVEGTALTIASVTSGAGGTAVLNGDGTVTFTPTANFNGAASFSYTVTDGALTSSAATVSVNVAAVNDAPVTGVDKLVATEDTPITYTAASLLGNDTDVEGSALTIASVTSGVGGTAVLNGDGTVTFTPTANFNGAASFSYTVTDGALTSNAATVSVNVAAVNDAPFANADTLAATEDTPVTYTAASLLGNDTDVEGTALTIASVTSGAGGTAVLNGDGTVTFTPTANFNGAASFSYTVSDGGATSNTATVIVNVAAVNDTPVATADTLAATEDTPVTYNAASLLGNDTDVEGTALSIASVTSGAGGTAVLNGDGTVTFTPSANFNGAASFSYTVSDGSASSNTAAVTVNVSAVNDAPVAIADTLAATEDVPITYTAAQLTGNDIDVDGPALSIASVTSGAGGTAVLNGDGTVTFTPTANFNGAASFGYTVSDGSAISNTAAVTVNVAAVNDVPVANADTLAATEDAPIIYTAAQLTGNDTDVDGTALTIASVTSGAGGTAVLNGDGTVTFTPTANFNGAASFSYTVSDGSATSNTAAVTVNVAAVNDAPVANTDTLAATEDTPVTYTAASLLGNDTDVEGATLTIASVTSGAGGTAVLNGDGSVTFTPNTNFNGTAGFSYTATDGTAVSNVAAVSVNVAAVNDAPVALPVTLAAIAEDSGARVITQAELLANANDIDSNSLTAVNLAIANGQGTLIDNLDGTWRYTPALNDDDAVVFNYQVSDGSIVATGSANLDITPVNDIAVLGGTAAGTLTEDASATLVTSGKLTISDADAGQAAYAPQAAANGLYGTFTLDASGAWTYTAANGSAAVQQLAAGAVASDSFVVSSLDGSAQQTVTVTLNGVNDVPVFTGDAGGVVVEDAAPVLSVSGALVITDADASQSQIVAQSATAGVYGAFSVDASGRWSYTASNAAPSIQRLGDGATLVDRFTVVSVDGSGRQDVVITLQGVNDIPVAADSAIVTSDAANHVFRTADFGYADVEGTPLAAIRITALPAAGTLTLAGAPVAVNQLISATDLDAGKLQFVAPQGNPARITTALAFQVSDGSAFSTTHTVAVTIEATLAAGAAQTAPVAAQTPDASAASASAGASTPAAQQANRLAQIGDDTLQIRKSQLVIVDDAPPPVLQSAETQAQRQGAALGQGGDLGDRRTIGGGIQIAALPQSVLPVAGGLVTAGGEPVKPIDPVVANRVASAITQVAFTGELDRVRNSVELLDDLDRAVVVSSVTAGAGMSVGYVLWLLRGGVLLSSVLTTLPAWRFVDPLPVLGQVDDEEIEDGESLESIVAEGGEPPQPDRGAGRA